MTETQTRPDQRTIDGFRAIVDGVSITGAELFFRNGYLWRADWIFGSESLITLTLANDDEIVICSSWLGDKTPGIGLTGTSFSSIAMDPNRTAVHTQEELVTLALDLIYNRH